MNILYAVAVFAIVWALLSVAALLLVFRKPQVRERSKIPRKKFGFTWPGNPFPKDIAAS